MHLTQPQYETGAARDFDGVRERLGQVREQQRHLARRAQVLLRGVAPHAPGVGEQRPVVDAHPRLVRFEILGFEEAHVVGRDHGQRAPRGERQCACDVRLLIRPAHALQFQIEAILEERAPELARPLRLGILAVDERATDIARGRTGERDQAGERLRAQPAPVDERNTALLAFKVSAT